MKSMIGLILILVLTGVVAKGQQSDRILVQGDDPLMQSTVNQLIDFFEFGLYGKFNDKQRAEFQAQRIADWQSGDPKDRETIRTLLDMRAKLMSLDDEKLKQAQTALQKYLIDNFGGQTNDPTARLLMEVYRNSRLNAISSGPVNNPVGGGGDVNDLLGSWGTGSVSGVNYVNNVTGSSTNGGGTQVMYTFKPGGKYEYAALTQSTLYNCTMKFLTYKSGAVQFQGSVLTFVPEYSTFTSEDSCVAKNNYKKPASMERETFNWSVQRDEYGIKMCLQNSSTNGCAYKR
jgi:hypothetical protein